MTARFKVSQRQPNGYRAILEQELARERGCVSLDFLPPEQMIQKIGVGLVLSHGVDHQVHCRGEGELCAVCTASHLDLRLSEGSLGQ